MNASSQVTVSGGNVLVEVHQHGKLIRSETVKNLVVTSGLDMVRDLILNYGSSPNSFAVGKGQSSTTSSMTMLEDEQFRNYFTRKTANSARATYQYVLGTTEANVSPQTLGEAALFSGSGYNGSALTTGGTMFARMNFTPVAKDSSMTITFTWDITIGN